MRVLIADDSRSSRGLLARLLESWGYEVDACEDGQSAYDRLRDAEGPRIAILDWVMPGMNGIEVCRRLRAEQNDRHVFIYLLTARSSAEDMIAGLEAGADDYLTKPFVHAELRIRLHNGVRLVQLHDSLIEAREALRTQAMVDPLTQVWNRRAFMDIARKEQSRARRTKRPYAVLVIDLDHFKRVNDTWGHAAGDTVLVDCAARVRDALRDGDQLSRFGGEEFVVLLPECRPPGAYFAAERVRRALARSPIVHGETPIAVTASIGVAACADGDEALESIIERADRALYQAKHGGRDRTVVAGPIGLVDTGS